MEAELHHVAVVGPGEERARAHRPGAGRSARCGPGSPCSSSCDGRAAAGELVAVAVEVVPARGVVVDRLLQHVDVVARPAGGRRPAARFQAGPGRRGARRAAPDRGRARQPRSERLPLQGRVHRHLQQLAPRPHTSSGRRAGGGGDFWGKAASMNHGNPGVLGGGRLRVPARQGRQGSGGGAVGQGPGAVDQPVVAAPQPPHAVVEVRVEVAVPDHVAEGVLAAAGAVERDRSSPPSGGRW